MIRTSAIAAILFTTACVAGSDTHENAVPESAPSPPVTLGRSALEEQNVATVNAFWNAFNSRDVVAFAATLIDDVQYRSTGARDFPLDKAAFVQSNGNYVTAFPDLKSTIEREIVEGNTVVTLYRLDGHFTGPFQLAPGIPPFPPTGVAGELTGIEVFTMCNLKACAMQDVWDQTSFLQQIQIQASLAGYGYPPTLAAADDPGAGRSPLELSNVATVKSLLGDIDAHQFDAVAARLAPTFQYQAPVAAKPLDGSGFIAFQASQLATFPDRHYDVRSAIVEGDQVVIQYYVAGGQYGALSTPVGTLPPTGRMTAERGTLIATVSGGQIVEIIDEWDTANTFSQLGL